MKTSSESDTFELKTYFQAREDHIGAVLDEARSNLSRISGDAARYPAILKGLVMQGLLQLLEKEVVLRCREKDLRLVEQLLPECLDGLQKEWGSTTKVVLDKQNFLPSESAGGVELSARAGKIKVSSTLESRLELIANQVIRVEIVKIKNILKIYRLSHKSEQLSSVQIQTVLSSTKYSTRALPPVDTSNNVACPKFPSFRQVAEIMYILSIF